MEIEKAAGITAISLLVVTSLVYCLHGTAVWALLLRIMKMLFCKGRKGPGHLTGLSFPVSVEELTSSSGPTLLTKMLQYGEHLPKHVHVKSVQNLQKDIKDGVKGDKALFEVTYSEEVELPKVFFVKFNLQSLGAMRLLMATSEVCLCEALFYHHLAEKIGDFLKTPKCFFVDFNKLSGEFCLLTEALLFGGPGEVFPLKHRIRDVATLEEQFLFVETGAKLHSHFWADNEVVRDMPKFHETHREMWLLCALSGRLGLSYTMRKTLRGHKVNEDWMTWECPAELIGKEVELIHDMPEIMTSLSNDLHLAAFGHNDLTTDNTFYWREDGKLQMGLFDWQQSCVNNVAQEWAWNWHFLEPDFLNEHEERLIHKVLDAYKTLGHPISKNQFLNAYVLGTVQMFVFGGGGLQLLMAGLHSKKIFESLVPNDPRCSDEHMDAALRTSSEYLGK